MHDLFEILGVAPNARAAEIRRRCRGYAPRTHPDVDGIHTETARPIGSDLTPEKDERASVDFARVGPIVPRMRTWFFGPEQGAV